MEKDVKKKEAECSVNMPSVASKQTTISTTTVATVAADNSNSHT